MQGFKIPLFPFTLLINGHLPSPEFCIWGSWRDHGTANRKILKLFIPNNEKPIVSPLQKRRFGNTHIPDYSKMGCLRCCKDVQLCNRNELALFDRAKKQFWAGTRDKHLQWSKRDTSGSGTTGHLPTARERQCSAVGCNYGEVVFVRIEHLTVA